MAAPAIGDAQRLVRAVLHEGTIRQPRHRVAERLVADPVQEAGVVEGGGSLPGEPLEAMDHRVVGPRITRTGEARDDDPEEVTASDDRYDRAPDRAGLFHVLEDRPLLVGELEEHRDADR